VFAFRCSSPPGRPSASDSRISPIDSAGFPNGKTTPRRSQFFNSLNMTVRDC
jgi:hypothetical protein